MKKSCNDVRRIVYCSTLSPSPFLIIAVNYSHGIMFISIVIGNVSTPSEDKGGTGKADSFMRSAKH